MGQCQIILHNNAKRISPSDIWMKVFVNKQQSKKKMQ